MNHPDVHVQRKQFHKKYRFIGHSKNSHLISPGIPMKRSLKNFLQGNRHPRNLSEKIISTEKSSPIIQTLKLIGQSASVLVSVILLLLMAIATWSGNIYLRTDPWMITALGLTTLLIFWCVFRISRVLQNKSLFIFILILLALSLIKIAFIALYAMHPIADYANYHTLAFAKASGVAWTKKMIGMNLFFPHVLNIATFFSIPYSLIGTNFATAQFINVFLTFFDAIFIYVLGKRYFNKRAGIIAGLLFSLIPAYFMYSVLDGAEPIFLTAVLALMICFNTFMNHDQNADIDQWVASFRNMSLLAIIAYMIRPTIGIWIVMGIIYLGFVRYPFKLNNSFKLTRAGYFLGFTLLFMLFAAFSTNIYSQIYKLPFLNNSVNDRYSLATGTSLKTNGAYNAAIYDRLEKDLKSADSTSSLNKQATNDMTKIAKQNIATISKKNDWLNFISSKYAAFSNEDYGYNWILYNTWQKNKYLKNFSELENPLIAFSSIFF